MFLEKRRTKGCRFGACLRTRIMRCSRLWPRIMRISRKNKTGLYLTSCGEGERTKFCISPIYVDFRERKKNHHFCRISSKEGRKKFSVGRTYAEFSSIHSRRTKKSTPRGSMSGRSKLSIQKGAPSVFHASMGERKYKFGLPWSMSECLRFERERKKHPNQCSMLWREGENKTLVCLGLCPSAEIFLRKTNSRAGLYAGREREKESL